MFVHCLGFTIEKVPINFVCPVDYSQVSAVPPFLGVGHSRSPEDVNNTIESLNKVDSHPSGTVS